MSASGPKADIETALCEDHSGLRLANFTTFLNFAVSAATKAPNSDGAPGNAVPPSSIKRVLILGSARLALVSPLSRSMIAAGVFAGAPMPIHWLASKPKAYLKRGKNDAND